MHIFRRRRGFHLTVAAALLMTILLGVGAALAYLATPNRNQTVEFTVEPGEGATDVAGRLKDDGVIRSETLFLQVLRSLSLEKSVMPGTHDLSGATSYAEIAERLAAAGKSLRHEVTITVKEGWTLRDIRDEMSRLGHPAADRLYEVTGQPLDSDFEPPDAWLDRYPFLRTRTAGTSLEGFLFPDTYRIYADASAEDVVMTMLDNFGRKMGGDVMRAMSGFGREFRDVIIMASLLEREVRTDETRRRVADIFWRRLDVGMRLQADSTVNYVTGGRRPSVTADDLAVDSPYNTYQHAGLPPGPIGNPGIAAIMAALSPEPNGYWFFLTDSDGGVHYATNFDAHVRNKHLYLR